MLVKRCTITLLVLAFLMSSLTSCSSGSNQGADSSQKPEYNQTKSMLLDILHSKEGKETLKDIVKEPSFKQSIAVSDHDVTLAIDKTLNDEKNQKKILEAQMKDPKFAASMVKAAKKEHETMLKQLLKDPDYQQSLLTIMKTPDFQKSVLTLMQAPEYRQQVMKVLTESLQNPEFKLVFMDAVKEAIQSGTGPSKAGGGGQEGKQQGGQGNQGGGQQEGQEGGNQEDKSKESENQSSDSESEDSEQKESKDK